MSFCRRQLGQHGLPRVEREPRWIRDGAVQDRVAADVGGRARVAAGTGAAGEGGFDAVDVHARGAESGGGGVRAEGLPQGEQEYIHNLLADHIHNFKIHIPRVHVLLVEL